MEQLNHCFKLVRKNTTIAIHYIILYYIILYYIIISNYRKFSLLNSIKFLWSIQYSKKGEHFPHLLSHRTKQIIVAVIIYYWFIRI